MSYLAIEDLSVVFRQFQLRGVRLELEQGQTLVLLGPSGSGKSVLLETIAGFHAPAAGRIELAGRPITHLPPEERGLGFMFQDYALFPHLTVEQNIAFGLGRQWSGRRWSSRLNGAARRVDELLALVGARHLAGRRPASLSGGERQRVALARAMAIRPRLFLFDEPLSALDAVMREMLREEMRLQLRSVAATSLYVTHDRQEALMLADTIAIIENGAIRQSGPAAELFVHPADAWVAEFLGLQVLCPHPPASGPEASGNGLLKLRVGGGALEVASHGTPIPASARLAFRPEDVHLEGLNGAGLNGAVGIPAAVEAVVATGPLYRIDLSSSAGNNGTPKHGARFHALVLRTELQRLGLRAGDRVLATLRPDDVILVPERRKPDRPD